MNHALRQSGRRAGAILLLVMACVLIVGVLITTLARTMSLHRTAQRQQQARWQALWLAESGIQRAAAQLAADPEYQGETWAPAAESLGGHPGTVSITLKPHPTRSDLQWATAQADFPQGASWQARVTRTLAVTVHPKSGAEKP